jgi:alkylation response protein AidB-like acyl-CoA dehydrogenase
VNLSFTQEQNDLRAMIRDFLADRSPESEVRRLMETEDGFDRGVWTQLSTNLGLCGLAVPERFGGAGYGFVEVGVVLEELGRSLACLPYFSSVVLAQTLLMATGDESTAELYLPGLADGSTRATVAFVEPSGRWDRTGITAAASKIGREWRVSGTKSFVIDGLTADVIFVAACTELGVSMFAVDGDADGLTRTPLVTLDQTRKQAILELTDTPARLVGSDGSGWAALSRMLNVAAVGLSAEAVGGGQAVLEMSVDYAKTRIQFGRPIGSFQAIKHKCADMLLELELAKSAAYHGLWVTAEDSADLPIAASLAKACCQDAFFFIAAENIQIHGGIGFTWEHPAHLYFKRAKSSQALLGDSTYHHALIADHIGI